MTRRLSLLAPLLLALSGCATLSPMEAPEVFMIGLEPLPGGSMEQRFQIQLRVLNPNQEELVVDGIDFTLDVNGSRLTRGLSGERVTIPRLGEAVVQVTATTTLFDIFRQLIAMTERTQFEYELHGKILRPGVSRSLRFERSGVLGPPAQRRPAVPAPPARPALP